MGICLFISCSVLWVLGLMAAQLLGSVGWERNALMSY